MNWLFALYQSPVTVAGMRRMEFSLPHFRSRELLAEARELHFASTTPEGRPVLRTVNPVVLGDRVCFHGSPKGEKTSCVGREAVAQCETVVATIPSYFVDPRRACPATTFFESVQVHGVLEPVSAAPDKARILAALMEKFQPEGGYEPLTAEGDLYRAAVRGLLVLSLSLERLTGKSKLGQNRTPQELRAVVEGLWRRGAKGDVEAIERVLSAAPSMDTPDFLRGPANLRLCVSLGEEDAFAVARLLEGHFGTEAASPESWARAQLGSEAWVAARDAGGRLVASARAIGDGVRHAYVADVVVDPAWRGRGVGKALVNLLLDHPAIRQVARVQLETADAEGFYAGLGFRKRAAATAAEPPTCAMVRHR